MSELWVKVKPWAVRISCGWLLLAFIFLCTSVEHSLFSAETTAKIYKTFSDIILLKWVTKYQTLLAGLAAVVGGTFVIWSQKLQINENRNLSYKAERSRFKAALVMTRGEIIHVTDHLTKNSLFSQNANLNLTRENFHIIASFDPRLIHITMTVVNRLELALSEKSKGDASDFTSTKFGWYASTGLCFAEMLKQVIDRLDKEVPLNVDYDSFDGLEVLKFLEKRGQGTQHIFELRPYFKWPLGHSGYKDMM